MLVIDGGQSSKPKSSVSLARLTAESYFRTEIEPRVLSELPVVTRSMTPEERVALSRARLKTYEQLPRGCQATGRDSPKDIPELGMKPVMRPVRAKPQRAVAKGTTPDPVAPTPILVPKKRPQVEATQIARPRKSRATPMPFVSVYRAKRFDVKPSKQTIAKANKLQRMSNKLQHQENPEHVDACC